MCSSELLFHLLASTGKIDLPDGAQIIDITFNAEQGIVKILYTSPSSTEVDKCAEPLYQHIH